MRQSCECNTQQEIVLIKHSDLIYILRTGSPAIVSSRMSNKYFFIKIISWNEQIRQRLRMTCVNMSSSTDDGSSWCVCIVRTKIL